MEEIRSKLVAYLKQPWPNRRLIGLICVIVGLLAVALSLPTQSSVTVAKVSTTGAPTDNPVFSSPSFFVHVVGEVKNPGVYSLRVGSRMFDAVFAAGGFLPSADEASINLARPLSDGEQIDVLRLDQSDGRKSNGSSSSLISINRADQQTLESLPGVGPALAGRIIDWRAANGGFRKKEDLLNVGGIGDKLFAGLSKLIVL